MGADQCGSVSSQTESDWQGRFDQIGVRKSKLVSRWVGIVERGLIVISA